MSQIPLRFLDADAFARLRGLLTRSGFTEAGVCAHAGIDSIFAFTMRQHAGAGEAPVERPLDLLVRLFMDSDAVGAHLIDDLLGGEARPLLESFGLIEPHPDDDSLRVATVLLYPTPGPWIASDRSVPIHDTRRDPEPKLEADSVYPALTSSARIFLGALPSGPVGDYLELCAGTGIAALMGAAAGAERVWAVDITHRSTVFADFNARLNGFDNVRALEGDLWAPLEGRTFDTIVAHPPYVPAAEPEYIYRDGGDDGEQISRAIIEGLPRHLAAGGLFQCTCLMSSRAGAAAPERVRAALGDASDEFDLVYVKNQTMDLTEHFRSQLLSLDREVSGRTAAQLRLLDSLDIETVHFCTIVLRRHDEDRTGFTLQVERGEETAWPHLAWALTVGAAATDGHQFAARIIDAPITLSPSARLEVTYQLGSDTEAPWEPTRGRIRVDTPFLASVEMGMSDATILSRFDGSRTLRQQLSGLQDEGRLPPGIDPLDFAASFRPMILAGIVASGAFPVG